MMILIDGVPYDYPDDPPPGSGWVVLALLVIGVGTLMWWLYT